MVRRAHHCHCVFDFWLMNMADDFFFSEREYSQIRKQVEWFQGMNVI